MSIREQELVSAFDAAMRRIEISPAFAEWALTEANRQIEAERATPAARALSLAQQIGRNEARLTRLKTLLIDGDLTGSDYHDLRQQVEAELNDQRRAVTSLAGEDDFVLGVISEKMEVAASAPTYGKASDEQKRGMIAALGGPHYLTLGKLQISMHPVVRKIAGFGPLIRSSQIPKTGDLLPQSSKWYTQ